MATYEHNFCKQDRQPSATGANQHALIGVRRVQLEAEQKSR